MIVRFAENLPDDLYIIEVFGAGVHPLRNSAGERFDGDPALVVRSQQGSEPQFSAEDLEARLTLRLPSILKDQIEEAAGDAGDSINTYVVKSLSRSSGRKRSGRKITETFRT